MSWVKEGGDSMHPNRLRAIARSFTQGYKSGRICEEYGISKAMLEAVLVDYGGLKNLRNARKWIQRRDTNGKKKTRQRRTDSVQS
jgi:hypothetical protein